MATTDPCVLVLCKKTYVCVKRLKPYVILKLHPVAFPSNFNICGVWWQLASSTQLIWPLAILLVSVHHSCTRRLTMYMYSLQNPKQPFSWAEDCYRGRGENSRAVFTVLTTSLKLFITQMHDRSFSLIGHRQVQAEYKMHTCRVIYTLVQHGVWRQVYPRNTDATCTVRWQTWWRRGLGSSLQLASLQPVPFEQWDCAGLCFVSRQSSRSIF